MEFVQYNNESDELRFFFRSKVLERGEYRGVGFDIDNRVARSRVAWTSIFTQRWAAFIYKEKQNED